MPHARLTPLSLVAGLVAVTPLAALILFINFLQICTLLLWIFSKPLFRRTNEKISEYWWNINHWVNVKFLRKSFHFHNLESIPLGENAVLIANHQSMTDVIALLVLADIKEAGDRTKFFVKDVLKYVPGIGWSMHFLNFIFLKRNWHSDAALINQTFRTIREEKIPFWMFNFPEGTRSTPKKIASSQNFAKQKSLPVLNHVLLPRTKGVFATLQGLQKQFEALYDITIAYDGTAPTLLEFYFCETKPITVYVERFSKSQIATEEEAFSLWMRERFVQKDKLLASLSGKPL